MMFTSRKKLQITVPTKFVKSLILGICFSLVLLQPVSFAQETSQDPRTDIRRLVEGGTVVLSSESGQTIFAINESEQLVPASIVKLLTSLIALKELGPDYHFSTEIYQKSNTEFWVKGYGDPFLVSEEIIAIAKNLKKKE